MKETVEDYIALLVQWIENAERSALEINNDIEYEEMQDRIITLKGHWVITKSILDLVIKAEG